jgi:hypothetical protein
MTIHDQVVPHGAPRRKSHKKPQEMLLMIIRYETRNPMNLCPTDPAFPMMKTPQPDPMKNDITNFDDERHDQPKQTADRRAPSRKTNHQKRSKKQNESGPVQARTTLHPRKRPACFESSLTRLPEAAEGAGTSNKSRYIRNLKTGVLNFEWRNMVFQRFHTLPVYHPAGNTPIQFFRCIPCGPLHRGRVETKNPYVFI